MGIARTLMYKGYVSEPLYCLQADGSISSGAEDEEPSFFEEYKRKLEGLYTGFIPKRVQKLAAQRQKAAVDFYQNLYEEADAAYRGGKSACKSACMKLRKRRKGSKPGRAEMDAGAAGCHPGPAGDAAGVGGGGFR